MSNGIVAVCKRFFSIVLAIIFFITITPALGMPFFPDALAATVWETVPNALVKSPQELKDALANSSVTTIYLGANIDLRQWGNTTNYINSNSSSNGYTNNSTYLMNIAVRTNKQLTIVGTDPTTGTRHTYTDRRTNDRAAIPFVLPSSAMTVIFKDIDIFGYNYYGLLYGNDSIAYNIVFDNVYGIMSQYLYLNTASVIVRDSVMKVRDTGLRTAEEIFECGNVRVEGNTVFDDQSTDNTTMFYLKNTANRSLTIADDANVTLIERGYNTYGITYYSGANLVIGERAKLTSVLAEREGPTGDPNANTGIGYTTGFNIGSSTMTAAQSYFTFSGSEAQSSIVIGKDSELNIIHPYDTTRNSYDILRTTTSAGITVNEGGILNIFSKSSYSHVLNTQNLILNNPRLITLYTTSPNNYMFNGTTAVKASKLKSIRYYSAFAGSYTFPAYEAGNGYNNTTTPLYPYYEMNATKLSDLYDYYKTFLKSNGTYESNRPNPTTWFMQASNSFDVTSANINGTGTISSSTYAGTSGAPGAATSLTSANFNASAMHVIQIDGDYSRRPTINQGNAGETTITGTGIAGAQVNLFDPSGTLLKTVEVKPDGTWKVENLTPLAARSIYSATQQANIAGYFSSPSGQVTMTVLAKTFRLIATNNAEKTYMTGYLNGAFNNIGNATNFEIRELKVIIFNDPDMELPAEASFDTKYTEIPNNKNGISYSVTPTSIPFQVAGADDYMTTGRLIQYNCKVWARAKIYANGTETSLYDTVSWKNIFTPSTVWLRAVIAGSNPLDRLFDYEVVNPIDTTKADKYGIPYQGNGTTVYASPTSGHDSVLLTAASTNLTHKNDLVEHWTATVGTPTSASKNAPYELKLDNNIDSALYDGTDPSKYTLNYTHKQGTWWEDAPVVFIDTSGNPVTISATSTGIISIPLLIKNEVATPHVSANNDSDDPNRRLSFRMLGGRYTPPSDTYSPVGWYVAASTGTSISMTTQSDFSLDSFNPIFGDSNQKLYIVYDTGKVKVTEEYYYNDEKIDTSKVQYLQNDNASYSIVPKYIAGYVPTGWQIDGGSSYTFNYDTEPNKPATATSVSNQYDIFPASSTTIAASNVTIKFYYTTDTRHNGIPDNEEGLINVRWRGTMVDGSTWSAQPFQTIYGRAGYGFGSTVTLPNTYTSLADIKAPPNLGDPDHKIPNTTVHNVPDGAMWLFDKGKSGNDTSKTGTFKKPAAHQDSDDVFFDYAFSTNGTDMDKDQFVTEYYYLVGSDGATTTSIATPSSTYILKGKTYSKMPPEINGYIYVGYRWDNGSNPIVYQNGMTPIPVSESTSGTNTHTVTFLYREKAKGSVTVSWIGETYAGTKLPFSVLTKTGYKGEIITIEANEVAVSSGWEFKDGSVEGGSATPSPTVSPDKQKLTFTLGDTSQTGTFMYKEVYDEVIITAKYISDDNSINFTQTFPKTLANSPDKIVVTPFTLNGYELTGWVINDAYGTAATTTSFNNGIASYDPVSIDPKNGSQTITFSYKTTLTNLYIRCYDEDGKEIAGTAQKISNVNVGETYYANAPIVKDIENNLYALKESEPLIKSTQITSGTNLIAFNYEKINNRAYIIMQEKDPVKIIGYRITPSTNPVVAPDLSGSYYTLDDSPSKAPAAILEFNYTKDTLDVVIQPVDQNNENIGTPTTLLNAARAGEMYTASLTGIPDVPGYSLADSSSKYVYATATSLGILVNPKYDPLVVKFAYKKDEIGDVNVTSWYLDDEGLEQTLDEYVVTAVVGSKLTINAATFTGFSVIGDGKQEITVKQTGSNIIKFKYNDDRKIVTVNHYYYTGLPLALTKFKEDKIRVLEGETYTVSAVNIGGNALVGYSFDTLGYIKNITFGASQIPPFTVTTDKTVYLYYDNAGTVITDQFVPVTVRGVCRTATGTSVLYEYTVQRLKNSGMYEVTAQDVFGYSIPSQTKKSVTVVDTSPPPHVIEFEYTSLSTYVTIKAVNTASSTSVDIIVPAVIGQPFSYNAPYVPGWNLSDTKVTQSIGSVSNNNTLTFNYTTAIGNVTVILREDSPNGRIIKTLSYNLTAGTETPIPVPDLLTNDYYDPISPQISVTYSNTPITVTYLYTKKTRNVAISQQYGADKISTASSVCRIGEVSGFSAPAPHAGYKLDGDAYRLVLIKNDTDPSDVLFNYTTILTTDLVVNAIDMDGRLLYTYTLTGTIGESATVPAPPINGYVLATGQPAIQTGTFGSSIEFKYAKNTVAITVKLEDTRNGGDITYLAPGDYPTTIVVTKGQPYTVVAPNIPGFVLDTGQSGSKTLSTAETQSDKSVTFKYRPVSALYITHTVIGVTADNNELYHYNFSVLKDEGTTTYTAAVFPSYTCNTSKQDLSNNGDGSITFTYAPATATITVTAVDDDDGSLIAGPFHYYDGIIGEYYSVRAPYVEVGAQLYALTVNQDLYQGDFVSEQGNSFEFRYTKVAEDSNILLLLKETDGTIINLIEIPPGVTTLSDIEHLLDGDYYKYDSSAVSVFPETNGVYTFYYEKLTRNIEIIAYKAKDNPTDQDVLLDTKTDTGRKGEMYTATPLSIPGYSLADQPSKSVYVSDDVDTLVIPFYYTEDQQISVTVRAFYKDSSNEIEILTYDVSGSSGSKMFISPPPIAGWTPKDDSPVEYIAGISTNNIISFEYTQKTAKVYIEFKDTGGSTIRATEEKSVQAEIPITISPPDIVGYSFISTASSLYANRVYDKFNVNNSYTLTFTYGRTTTQSAITVVYADTNGNQLGTQYVDGSIGATADIAPQINSPPSFVSNYTFKEILFKGMTYTTTSSITQPPIFGTDREVTLIYSYSGVGRPPTDGGSFTTNPPNPKTGDSVTITITPDDGYELADLIITKPDGTVVDYNPKPPVLNSDGKYIIEYTQPEGGVIIRPTFRPKGSKDLPVIVNPTDNGSVTVEPDNPATGQDVTLTLTPNPGYELDVGSVVITDKNGNPVSPVSITPNGDGTYTVKYKQPSGGSIVNAKYKKIAGYTNTVTVDDTENGGVTISPASPTSGQLVTVTVTPNYGYDLSTLSIKSGITTVTYAPSPPEPDKNTDGKYTGTYTVTYIQPAGGATVHAEFVPKILIKNTTNGTATVSNMNPNIGELVTITVTPAAGYTLSKVTLNGSDITATKTANPDGTFTLTYTQPKGGVVITADFVSRGGGKVTIKPPDHGTVTISPAQPKAGELVTVTITPDEGYTVEDAVIKDKDGKPVPHTLKENADGTFTVTYIQPDGEVNIDVKFVLIAKVTITTDNNGDVRVNPEKFKIGDTVYVVTVPNYGYTLNTLTFTNASNTSITPTRLDNGLYSFKHTGGDFKINATFSPSEITLKTTNGSVTMTPANPRPGDPVIITATPNHGYMYTNDLIKFTNESGIPIALTINETPLGISTAINFVWPTGQPKLHISIDFATLSPASHSSVVVWPTVNGGVTVAPYSPDPDQNVILTARPNPGFEVKGVRATASGISIIELTTSKNTDGTWTIFYKQPDVETVYIEALFGTPADNIQFEKTGSGNIVVPEYAPPGEKVSVIIKPDDGFTIKSITINDIGDISIVPATEYGVYLGYFIGTYIQPNVETQISSPSSIQGRSTQSRSTTGNYNSKVYVEFEKTINITSSGNGTYSPENPTVNYGDIVKLDIKPNSGNILKSITSSNGANAVLTRNLDGTYEYSYTPAIMGINEIDIAFAVGSDNTGTPDPGNNNNNNGNNTGGGSSTGNNTGGSSSGGGGGSPSGQGGSNINPPDHGSIIVDKSDPSPGDKVKVIPKPDNGYELDKLVIKDSSGNDVPYTKNADGSFSYIQPNSKVTITATFKLTATTASDSDVSRLLDTINHNAYVMGTGNGKFEPEAVLTRAQAAQLFYNLLKEKDITITAGFKDVADKAWYAKAVRTLATLGIITGYPDGDFHPDDIITRAQFTVMVVRFAKVSPGNTKFSDVPETHWAYSYISTAANYGWVTGVGDGRFEPERSITRAEVVTLMNRVLKHYPDKTAIDSNTSLTRFSDVSTGHWAYYQIIEASNSHSYERNNVTEKWK